MLTRRRVLTLTAGVAAAAALPHAKRARAADEIEAHGLSAFGDLAYPADFAHFSYVDPQAPKGGTFSQIGPSRQFNQNFLTFNSLNSYILKGDAAQGMELTFATLMVRSGDEPDAMYGLAAAKVRRSADGLTYRFFIRPEAKFHDGTRLTAQDVAFSLNMLKEKGHPIITQLLRDFTGAKADDDESVVATFAPNRARDVPLFVAGLPIFSRAYYAKKPFDESTLDTPLGSGPYKVGRFEAGRFIEYERVKDWWGADLPVARGQNNFDVVRYEYYRDREVGFEGFTAGSYLFREEFTSRTWATRYDFPAFKDGRVKRDIIPDKTPSGAQGWFINTRRKKFADPRLREALCCAFDFEWTNKTLMWGSYDRTISVFQNSDMMANGKPGADELALLEPFRGRVPDEVFGEPYAPPVSDGSGQDRALLRKASQLLKDAGCDVKDGKRVLPGGEPIVIEFLLEEPTFQPHHMPFIKNLGPARHRCVAAPGRSGAISRAPRRFRFRSHRRSFQPVGHARRLAAFVFFLAGGAAEGLQQSRRHGRSGDRFADRNDHRGAVTAGTGDGLPRARPRDPLRALLDPALVQAYPLDRLLGRVRPAAGTTTLFPRYPGHLVV